ncbi:MAG: AraC family transcriptional regulator [Victivallales bacterium]|jgi:AraC-like DNA-binding protein|nr:AraC family transcriptional regulator [Victivallales bacterium]
MKNLSNSKNQSFEGFAPFFTERTEQLHSMLLNCGHELTRSHEYRWDGRKRGNSDLLIWQYTLSGAGEVFFNGQSYPVLPGNAFFLMVPESHIYFLPPESKSWEFIYISLSGSELVRLGSEFRRRNGVVRPFAPDSPAVQTAWNIFATCHEKRLTNRYDASAMGYSFMMSLMAEPPVGQFSVNHDFMAKIHDFCNHNLHRPITVDELAQVARCSRGYFTRKFHEIEGISPHEFVMRQKMRLAVRMLQTTISSVKEISDACGFEDPSYFCKVFKHYHGVTPGGYRHGGKSSQ